MAGFFFQLGQMLGRKSRKTRWFLSSIVGTRDSEVQAEHRVGRDLAQEILEQGSVDADPQVARWLQEVGGLLQRRWPRLDRQFTFQSLLDPEPNAFALPGGFIFVTRSLLLLCQSSHAQLAFVLGHEMAHVQCGHAAERMQTRSILGTILRGPLTGITAQLLHQSYSRDQEYEADLFAVRLLRAAGFDPRAGIHLLRQLQFDETATHFLQSYFATHPPLQERIQRLQEEIRQRPAD